MQKVFAIIAAVVVAALVIVTWFLGRGGDDQFAGCRQGQIGTGTASIGGPFTLVDENGATVTDQDVFTKPTLLYFGYTFCPDVCPADTARNAEALDLLQADGFDVGGAFISIDPERDTPEQVKDFTSYLHDDMLGLTGTPEQVKAASLAYKTYFKKEEDGDPEYYLVDHSTFTYLVLPELGFVEFFNRDTTAEDMASRTSCFIKAAK